MDVKPVAWRVRMYGSRGYAENEKLLAYLGEPVEPLFDQAALDAAVAAERERCAQVCEDGDTRQWGYVETTSDLREALATAIRKG